MKVNIPPYIKNILKYCGYENCHTIATIEENDLEYFTAEIRHCADKIKKLGMQAEFFLEGSTKGFDDFELVRGHQKLLMAVAKLVRDELETEGVNGFLLVSSKKKKINKPAAPHRSKKMKFSSNEPLSLSDETSDVMDNPTASSEDTSFERQTKIVLLKALASLKYHNIFFMRR